MIDQELINLITTHLEELDCGTSKSNQAELLSNYIKLIEQNAEIHKQIFNLGELMIVDCIKDLKLNITEILNTAQGGEEVTIIRRDKRRNELCRYTLTVKKDSVTVSERSSRPTP